MVEGLKQIIHFLLAVVFLLVRRWKKVDGMTIRSRAEGQGSEERIDAWLCLLGLCCGLRLRLAEGVSKARGGDTCEGLSGGRESESRRGLKNWRYGGECQHRRIGSGQLIQWRFRWKVGIERIRWLDGWWSITRRKWVSGSLTNNNH